jgi:leucyl aminopeptidase
LRKISGSENGHQLINLATFSTAKLANMTVIKRAAKLSDSKCLVIICSNADELKKFSLSATDIEYFRNAAASERKSVAVTTPQGCLVVLFKDRKTERNKLAETLRKAGSALIAYLNDNKCNSVELADATGNNEHLLYVAEGMLLANYQFLKYKTNAEKEKNALDELILVGAGLKEPEVNALRIAVEATFIARDLVNEPAVTLTAEALSDEFKRLGKDAGFRVEVLNKAKITSLKMGGLLAVNKGSDLPPTFTIMEHKPARPRNKKPVVLVGKGVVYDTGGYNVKVGTGMETMKCDMAGAATVGATMWAIAKANLNVHVIGIVPATDNRINGNAYVAGDVITMYNGKTVEVLNTDAEGRLILGDALAYAEKFEPGLVMDFATLTGAAMVAIGPHGIVSMGTAGAPVMRALEQSGLRVHERLAEFPFWDEYGEEIISSVADIKNLGGGYAGAITAGKFLAHFVKAPWVHFDIAGPAFITAKDAYRSKGGTGVGVRLMIDFLAQYKG